MKRIIKIIKKLLHPVYYGVMLVRIAGLAAFFKQLKRQIYCRFNQIGLTFNLEDSEIPKVVPGIKYTLKLATQEDMEEVTEKAEAESKQMMGKVLFRKMMFDNGCRNCYIARTAGADDICSLFFIIFPSDVSRLKSGHNTWFPWIDEDEAILAGAYTFEKYRCNQLISSLHTQLLGICKEQGYKRVSLYIEDDNEASLKVAERLGYRRFRCVAGFRLLFFTFRKCHRDKSGPGKV